MLVLDRVGKTYPNGVHALDGVSLDVEPGEIVAVIGGSGCGKSTLLRAIGGLDPASEGTVTLDSERITRPHEKIGIIFQEPRLLPRRSNASGCRTRPRYGRANSPAVRRSVLRLRGRWCRARKCCCSTSHFPRSMLSLAPICRIICSICG